jgi:hypothetical protein
VVRAAGHQGWARAVLRLRVLGAPGDPMRMQSHAVPRTYRRPRRNPPHPSKIPQASTSPTLPASLGQLVSRPTPLTRWPSPTNAPDTLAVPDQRPRPPDQCSVPDPTNVPDQTNVPDALATEPQTRWRMLAPLRGVRVTGRDRTGSVRMPDELDVVSASYGCHASCDASPLMGNPHRFFGTGQPIELEEGDVLPPKCVVEVTFRTHQQRLLLRPDEDLNALMLGCFARALERYPDVNVHVLSILSNHGSFLCFPKSPWVLWSFMRDFLSAAAKKVNGLRNREGTLWARRYRAIPVLDEAKLDERFEYILTQGTKENLVWSARDWPGVTSIPALLGEEQLIGRWRDGTRECELRRQRERRLARASAGGREIDIAPAPEIWREHAIEFVPLPHWCVLPAEERRERVAALLRADDESTRKRHARDGTRPLGVAAILAADPFARPLKSKKSPAPRCHTTSKTLRRGFYTACQSFAISLNESAHTLEVRLADAGVPEGASIRPLCHRSPADVRQRAGELRRTEQAHVPTNPIVASRSDETPFSPGGPGRPRSRNSS